MNNSPSSSRVGQTFAALQHPNYRLWFMGQVVSLFGTWMQNTAQGFLIYDLTKSPAYLGYVSFAAGVPSILMLYGGVVADRVPRRKLMIITQTLMLALAFVLAGLVFADIVQPWHIVALSAALGVVNAFDAPARLSLAPELVPPEDLTNAIALNAAMFNLATVVGPTIAGFVYAWFGPGWCFVINGISFIAVIAALGLMKLSLRQKPTRPGGMKTTFHEIGQGLTYVLHRNHTVLIILVIMAVMSVFGYSFQSLLPAWAVDVLKGDVTTNGLLRSGQGVGALLGALSIASMGRGRSRGRILTVGIFLFPLLLLAFSFARWLPLTLILLGGLGISIVMINNLSNSLIQTSVEDELRGRISSIYSLTFFGFMPLGSLMMGWLAEYINEPVALEIGGAFLVGFALLLFWRVPKLRRLE
jgi:MFS family permease